MSTTTKIKSFVKQTLASLTGNTDEVLAQKNFRMAISAVDGQIAALKADLVDAEERVKDAEEALEAAKYPSTAITNRTAYLAGIVDATENLEEAQASHANVKASIAFNEALKSEFEKEVTE